MSWRQVGKDDVESVGHSKENDAFKGRWEALVGFKPESDMTVLHLQKFVGNGSQV